MVVVVVRVRLANDALDPTVPLPVVLSLLLVVLLGFAEPGGGGVSVVRGRLCRVVGGIAGVAPAVPEV